MFPDSFSLTEFRNDHIDSSMIEIITACSEIGLDENQSTMVLNNIVKYRKNIEAIESLESDLPDFFRYVHQNMDMFKDILKCEASGKRPDTSVDLRDSFKLKDKDLPQTFQFTLYNLINLVDKMYDKDGNKLV